MRPPPTCDGCGGEYPLHLHYCMKCMEKAAPGLWGKFVWWVAKRVVQAGATCPNCKTPFFLTRPFGGRWEIIVRKV